MCERNANVLTATSILKLRCTVKERIVSNCSRSGVQFITAFRFEQAMATMATKYIEAKYIEILKAKVINTNDYVGTNSRATIEYNVSVPEDLNQGRLQ